MIEDFLSAEVLLSPHAYKRIKELEENRRLNLINKIKKFKNSNDSMILLDAHFLNIFLNNDLENILNNYKNFDFMAYYTSDGFSKEEDVNSIQHIEPNLNEVGRQLEDGISNSTEDILDSPLNRAPVQVEELYKKVEVKEEDSIECKYSTKDSDGERNYRLNEIRSIRESINKKINYLAKDIETKLHVYNDIDVTGKSTCEGTIEDFVKYFRDRYNRIKKIIEAKSGRRAYPLSKIYNRKREDNVFVVGIITEINTTKNGHKRIIIEDEKDSFTVLMMKDKILNGELPDDILLDEVIGFEGAINDKGDAMFANRAIRPDVTPRSPKCTDEKVYTAFLSDIHVGSHEFMEKTFKKFIEFLNGDVNNGLEEKIVSRLKYISIAGDLVDGVGIYPGQEYDLYEVDIISQYREVATYLEQIPDHIQIIISPGNHDALRPAEPQPALPDKITNLFEGDNFTFVANPGMVNIHGLDLLLYHGRSFDDVIGQISTAKYTEPSSIMKELLKRRHLCPTYGGRCPIAPEHIDYLAIEREPDIFHTGHIHINGYGIYKGVAMINSGTFQEQTSFQKKMGIHPTPGIVPILDMSKIGTGGYYLEWNNGKLEVKQ